jgi:hypothetical protein
MDNSPKEKKNYCPGVNIKERKFSSGRNVLNVNLCVVKVCEWLKTIENEKGYANVSITALRDVGKYGQTHCMWENTWKPESQSGNKPTPQKEATASGSSRYDTDEPPF